MTAPENPPAPAIAPPPSQRPRPPWALALAGLFFLIGGGKLISLGGSWYFLLAGLGLLLSGLQLRQHWC